MRVALDLFELFADVNLILKLFVFVMIVQFVQAHLGRGPMAIGVIALMSFFVLFDSWKVFGGIYLLYAMVTLGVVHLLTDYFFVSPPLANQREQRQQAGGDDQGVTSADVKGRLHRIQQQRHVRPPGPPPMMG